MDISFYDLLYMYLLLLIKKSNSIYLNNVALMTEHTCPYNHVCFVFKLSILISSVMTLITLHYFVF